MFNCASRKLGLDQAIMQSVEAESKNRHNSISKDLNQVKPVSTLFKASDVESKEELSEKTLSKQELEKMLKYGAYAIVDEDEYEKKIKEFCDEDIDKMAAVNSNTQLYKQFGNSIVVDVMCAMFKNLNIEQR